MEQKTLIGRYKFVPCPLCSCNTYLVIDICHTWSYWFVLCFLSYRSNWLGHISGYPVNIKSYHVIISKIYHFHLLPEEPL